MAVPAVRCFRSRSVPAATNVVRNGHQAKMFRVDAVPNTADVIDGQVALDRPVDALPGVPMRCLVGGSHPELAVPVAIDRPRPQVTARLVAPDLGQETRFVVPDDPGDRVDVPVLGQPIPVHWAQTE